MAAAAATAGDAGSAMDDGLVDDSWLDDLDHVPNTSDVVVIQTKLGMEKALFCIHEALVAVSEMKDGRPSIMAIADEIGAHYE